MPISLKSRAEAVQIANDIVYALERVKKEGSTQHEFITYLYNILPIDVRKQLYVLQDRLEGE